MFGRCPIQGLQVEFGPPCLVLHSHWQTSMSPSVFAWLPVLSPQQCQSTTLHTPARRMRCPPDPDWLPWFRYSRKSRFLWVAHAQSVAAEVHGAWKAITRSIFVCLTQALIGCQASVMAYNQDCCVQRMCICYCGNTKCLEKNYVNPDLMLFPSPD